MFYGVNYSEKLR